jgi:type II secretory pathway pseudopilin PulG
LVEPRRSGFTLLEVAIYFAVLSVIGVPLLLTALTVTRSTEEGNMLAKILERNRSALHRIGEDFRRSLTGTTSVTNSGKTLTFTLPGGFNGTGASAGNVISYRIQDDSSDLENGTDDNGNGIADEKILLRVNVSTNESVQIGAYLFDNESGFVVDGNGVVATITTFGWTPGSPVQSKITQSITLFPRN